MVIALQSVNHQVLHPTPASLSGRGPGDGGTLTKLMFMQLPQRELPRYALCYSVPPFLPREAMANMIFAERQIIHKLDRQRSFRLPVVERSIMNRYQIQPSNGYGIEAQAQNRDARPNRAQISSSARHALGRRLERQSTELIDDFEEESANPMDVDDELEMFIYDATAPPAAVPLATVPSVPAIPSSSSAPQAAIPTVYEQLPASPVRTQRTLQRAGSFSLQRTPTLTSISLPSLPQTPQTPPNRSRSLPPFTYTPPQAFTPVTRPLDPTLTLASLSPAMSNRQLPNGQPHHYTAHGTSTQGTSYRDCDRDEDWNGQGSSGWYRQSGSGGAGGGDDSDSDSDDSDDDTDDSDDDDDDEDEDEDEDDDSDGDEDKDEGPDAGGAGAGAGFNNGEDGDANKQQDRSHEPSEYDEQEYDEHTNQRGGCEDEEQMLGELEGQHVENDFPMDDAKEDEQHEFPARLNEEKQYQGQEMPFAASPSQSADVQHQSEEVHDEDLAVDIPSLVLRHFNDPLADVPLTYTPEDSLSRDPRALDLLVTRVERERELVKQYAGEVLRKVEELFYTLEGSEELLAAAKEDMIKHVGQELFDEMMNRVAEQSGEHVQDDTDEGGSGYSFYMPAESPEQLNSPRFSPAASSSGGRFTNALRDVSPSRSVRMPRTPRPVFYQASYDSFERTGSEFGSKRRRDDDSEDNLSSDEDLPVLGDSHSSPILNHQSRISHKQRALASLSASAFSTVARSQYGTTTKRPRLQTPESSPGSSPSAPSRRPRVSSRTSPASSTRRERRPFQLLASERGTRKIVSSSGTSTPIRRNAYQQVASGSSSPFYTPSPSPSRARAQFGAGPSSGSASPRNPWDRSLCSEYPHCDAQQPPSGNTPPKHPFIFTPKGVVSPAQSGISTPDPSLPTSVYRQHIPQDPREERWNSPSIA